MRRTKAFTLVELMVVIGIIGLLLAILVPALQSAREMANRGVCMSNLSSINKGLVLYKSANDDKYPWLFDKITTWDKTKTGEASHRKIDPFKAGTDPNSPTPRSITTLMFMLVRSGQAPGIFRCPSDRDSTVDDNVKAGEKDQDIEEGQYYWDFNKPENVSYSYQAPRYVSGTSYDNGVNPGETEMAIYADMTPKYGGDTKWQPAAIDDDTTQGDIEKNLSNNHKGVLENQIHVLKVAGNVKPEKRPDCGVAKDNIYTEYGTDFKNRRKATGTSLSNHKRDKDTYLIGPVGRSEPEGTE